MTERWLPVVGDSGYEVSDAGRVRGLDRVLIRTNGRPYPVRGVMLRPQPTKPGYRKVEIGPRTRHMHALVLEAFVGPCPDGMECCHENRDRADNRLSNLRWDTHSGNMRDALRHGTHPTASRTHCPSDHRLVMPNLVRSILPDRGCLACNRARARARWLKTKGIESHHKKLADAYYVEIMKEAA